MHIKIYTNDGYLKIEIGLFGAISIEMYLHWILLPVSILVLIVLAVTNYIY